MLVLCKSVIISVWTTSNGSALPVCRGSIKAGKAQWAAGWHSNRCKQLILSKVIEPNWMPLRHAQPSKPSLLKKLLLLTLLVTWCFRPASGACFSKWNVMFFVFHAGLSLPFTEFTEVMYNWIQHAAALLQVTHAHPHSSSPNISAQRCRLHE